MSIRRSVVVLVTASLVAGCVLAPRAAREERARAEVAGAAWMEERAARVLPDLPAEPTWREVLRRALLANGDLEGAYHAWRGALARVDVAAAWPNTNAKLGYEHMFSDDGLKAWDRTTISVGFDPMQNLSFPTKAMASGRQALEEARAAGARFLAAKLALQQRVLTAWWALVLATERLAIARETAALLAIGRDVRLGTVGAGAEQRLLVESHLAAVRADDAEASLAADVVALRARLNALLARPADAPLAVPRSFPPPRPVSASDDALLATALASSPSLDAARRDLAARREAIGRARQEWIPDFNPFAGVTGDVAQVAGVAVLLPTRVTLIRGAIAEAKAMEARADATAAQRAADVSADVVAALVALRDAERRTALWDETVLPATRQLVDSVRSTYETGGVDLATMIDAEQLVLEARDVVATARAAREMRLADLERVAGFDVETLAFGEEERS